MADGQDELNQLAAQPVNPVQQVPSAPTTGLITPATASDVLAGIQAAQNTPAPTTVMPQDTMTAQPSLPAQPAADVHEHMSLLHRILDRVGTALGGGETLHATKDASGNMSVTRSPSTMGEKWGRIAAAALGGAAQGLANAQGPGGLARATAAGIQYGTQLPQQQRQQVEQEATAEQQIQLRNAQKAMLQQQIAQNAFNMKAQGWKLRQDMNDTANQGEQWVLSNPSNKKVGDFNNMDDVIRYENTHGDLIKNHASGAFHTEVQPDGSVRLYTVDRGWMDALNDKPVDIPELQPGKDISSPMTLTSRHIDANTMSNRDISTMREARLKQITDYNVKLSAEQDKQSTATQTREERQREFNEREQDRKVLEAIAAGNLSLRRDVATGALQPGGAAPDTTAQGGEAYLQTIPQNMRNQVQAIARGDVKMPPASSRGSNQAIRNAVLNYDPTYTDARYTTKQNFKTNKDADTLKSLSTSLAHAENALTNSAALGYSISPEHSPTEAGAKFRQDAEFLTDEIGTLVKGNALTQGQGEKRIQDLHSSLPWVREAAIREQLNLLGGRVSGIFNKYRAGAGQELPVQEFFDADTQARLKRYGVHGGDVGSGTPAPGATGGGQPAAGGTVQVQIPGSPPGRIPRSALDKFKQDHPNAVVTQ